MITYTEAHGTVGPGAAADVSLVGPAVSPGDTVLIFTVLSTGSSLPIPTWTAPAGFADIPDTPVATVTAGGVLSARFFASWKRASVSESGTYTAHVSDGCTVSYTALALRGCAPSPWDATAAAVTASGAAGACPAVSVTTTGAGRTLLLVGGGPLVGGTTTPSAGFSVIHDDGNVWSLSTKAQAAAGSSGSVSATRSGGDTATFTWVGALKPRRNQFLGLF